MNTDEVVLWLFIVVMLAVGVFLVLWLIDLVETAP